MRPPFDHLRPLIHHDLPGLPSTGERHRYPSYARRGRSGREEIGRMLVHIARRDSAPHLNETLTTDLGHPSPSVLVTPHHLDRSLDECLDRDRVDRSPRGRPRFRRGVAGPEGGAQNEMLTSGN